MNLRPWLKYSGLSAMWGGVLGVASAVLTAAAYYNQVWSQASAPRWADALIAWLPSALQFDAPRQVYLAYGRLFLLVYVLLLAGALGLQVCCLLRGAGRPGWGFRLVAAGLAMGLVGNLADYWLGTQAAGRAASVIGFIIGAELGALVYTAGALLMAWQLYRKGPLLRWQVLLFGLAPLLGILLSFWGVRHIPAGFILPVSLSWLVIGLHMWIEQTQRRQPNRDNLHLKARPK